MRPKGRLQLLLLTCVIASAGGLSCHRPPRASPDYPASTADRGFQALYQVRLERPAASRSLRLTLAVSDGTRFRVEALGPLGGARLAIVFDGTWLRAALPSGQLCGAWEDTAVAMGELTGIALPAPQWLALLLGRLTSADLEASAIQIDELRDGRVVRLRLAEDGLAGAGGLRTVTYADFRPAPGGDLAAQVRLRDGAQEVTLSLRQLQPLPPPVEALLLPCPPGFRAAGADAFSAAGISLLGEGR